MRFHQLFATILVVIVAFAVGRVTAPTTAEAAMPEVAFSHFECYQATFKGQFGASVELTDQFQQFNTGVGAPELFCTPVTKKVISGPHHRVPKPPDHLTCYAIQGPTIQQTRTYTNQFVSNSVTVGTPSLLCVPTNKQG